MARALSPVSWVREFDKSCSLTVRLAPDRTNSIMKVYELASTLRYRAVHVLVFSIYTQAAEESPSYSL
jgi:hypothetical protein